MSEIMERTLASIPRILSTALGGVQGENRRQSLPSQAFQNLLRAVDHARSHSEQEAVVHRELHRITELFKQPGASVAQWCECLPQIIFCSTMGYDVTFSYIYVLKLAATGKGRQKRLGYLAAVLLLDATNDITLLFMGTLLKDLTSSNMVENHMALSAASELVRMEHIHMMLPRVTKLLRHRHAFVRARAVYCMQAFFCRDPGLKQDIVPEVKSLLADKDPGVLRAVVTMVVSVVEHNSEEFVDQGKALINMLQQVRARKFPGQFNYHGIPLPWLQIKLLKVLAHLGPTDYHFISTLIPVLSQIIKDTIGREIISLAILEECLMTIVALAEVAEDRRRVDEGAEKEDSERMDSQFAPSQAGASAEEAAMSVEHDRTVQNKVWKDEWKEWAENSDQRMTQLQPLLEEASKCVGRFLDSSFPNLRYLGVKILTHLVSINADLAVPHKSLVVKFLSDPDLIVRQQTLILLHRMANRNNVKVICSTMLKHVQHGDSSSEVDIIDMVVDVSSRLSSDPEWYLYTLFPLLSLRLDPTQLASISDSMLNFFTETAQHSADSAFVKVLFTTMVNGIIEHEDKGSCSVQFCLRVLRFVPLPVHGTFPAEEFLAACAMLLSSSDHTVDVKEQVALCVQTLLLQGHLDKTVVSAWTGNLLDQCDVTTHFQYQFILTELHKLTSLDLTGFSTPSSVQQVDFTFSFLDSYTKNMLKKEQPMFRTVQSPERGEADIVDADHFLVKQQEGIPSVSEDVKESLASSGSSPLYESGSDYSESFMEDSLSSASGLQKVLGTKRKWNERGFSCNADEQKTPTTSAANDIAADKQTADSVSRQQDKDEELVEALFQGMSSTPKPQVVVSLSSAAPASLLTGSEKSSTSSGFDSSSSQNSGTGCQDMLMDSILDQAFSSSTTTETSHPHDANSESDPQSCTVGEEFDDLSLSPLPPSTSNRWKTLLTAPVDDQEAVTPESDQHPSPADQAQHLLSNLGSGSSLSISDDSLENTRGHSIPNSPTEETVQSQSNPPEETPTGQTVQSQSSLHEEIPTEETVQSQSSLHEETPTEQAVQSQSSLHEETSSEQMLQSQSSLLEESGQIDDDTDETVLSEFLETQMMESETTDDAGACGEDSLYSGFEILAQSSDSCEDREKEIEVEILAQSPDSSEDREKEIEVEILAQSPDSSEDREKETEVEILAHSPDGSQDREKEMEANMHRS